MVAIVTLFDFYPSDSPAPYTVGDYSAGKQHIKTVVNALGPANPAVMAWDIKNEMDRDYAAFGETQVKAWANEMISYTRQLDPNHLLTLGFYGAVSGALCYNSSINGLAYDPSIAAAFASSIDFVSMHYFLSERCFEQDLQALQAAIGNKPLVLEEFGLHTLANPAITCASAPGNPLCDDPHTEAEQAAYYNALLSVSEAYDLAGYLFWTLNDFSHILPDSQQSHHCQGIVRNSQVTVCEATTPSDYSWKPAAESVRRHYENHVRYLDLFDGWTDINTDDPPAGWTDNWQEGGGMLRGKNLSQPLWSQTSGAVAFSKFVTGATSITGVATSPLLLNVDVDRYPRLAGRVISYSIRDATYGSHSILHLGVKEGSEITRLLTVAPNSPLPFTFGLDLGRPPLNWNGEHSFQIVLELVPKTGTNGYSATYEFDWIDIQGSRIYLPLIVK